MALLEFLQLIFIEVFQKSLPLIPTVHTTESRNPYLGPASSHYYFRNKVLSTLLFSSELCK
jgi:hypothetical protein